jgi:hypothetical protein
MGSIVCWSCKSGIEIGQKVTRQDLCPSCSNPIRCCFNCKHYSKEAFHQCEESAVAEWVRYKEKANFCEYYFPRFPQPIKKVEKPQNPEDRKKAWDQLFEE